MAYTPIGWLNDQAPAINQTNLNKMDNELVFLDKENSTNQSNLSTIENNISKAQNTVNVTNYWYGAIPTMQMGLFYIIGIKVQTAGTYTVKVGTNYDQSAMVDTLFNSVQFVANETQYVLYTPTVSGEKIVRLSSNTVSWSITIAELIKSSDLLDAINTLNQNTVQIVAQSLTDSQKEQARSNINAVDEDEFDLVTDALNLVTVPSINLYDNSNPTIINGFLGASSGSMKFSSSPAAKCLVMQLEAETTYTISKSSANGRWTFGLFSSTPTDQSIGSMVSGTYKTQDSRNYFTFTTGTTNLYLVFYYYNSNDGVAETTIRATVMLSKGTTLYPYIPYGDTKLLVIEKENLNSTGSAGQALMLDEDGESLIWGEPPAQVIVDPTLSIQGEAADAKATGDAISSVLLSDGAKEWLDEHPEAMIVIKVNGDANDTPELGEEMLSSSGWTSTGWTGDFTNGFTHTTGNTNPLSVTLNSLEENALYQFMITTSNAATNGWSDFYVSLGGSDTFETYRGGGASVSYTYGLICGSTKVLRITPRNDYTGTVTGLSLKKVTNYVGAQIEINDTDGALVFQNRFGKSARDAIYEGKNSGKKAFWGYENVGLGDDALANVTSGFWNTAVGRRALQSNQNGSRNVAIGYIALRSNTGGDRNIAIGTFTLEKNTTGRNNVAINADSMQDNTTGHDNVGIGVRSLVGNTTGFYNIGIGNNALAANKTGSGNVGIGENALANTTGSNNIAIGNNAGDASGMSGNNNIVIGYNVDVTTPSSNNQIVIGDSSQSVKIAGKTINFNQDGTVTWS